jgi:hypothetical protein
MQHLPKSRDLVIEQVRRAASATAREIAGSLPAIPTGTISSALTVARRRGEIHADGTTRNGQVVYRYGPPPMHLAQQPEPRRERPAPRRAAPADRLQQAYRDGYRDGHRDALASR